MLNFALPVLLVGAIAPISSSQDSENQAFLAILAETSLTKMAGMPAIELPPGVELPEGIVMPGQASRSLNVRLWSPGLAPENAYARLAPPAGLKKGQRLDLEIYRPKPDQAEPDTDSPDEFDPAKMPKFTIKYYWGSSASVQPNQPKVVTWGGLSPEEQVAMRKRAKEMRQNAAEYFYKPNWTTAYWPTKKQPGAIDMSASLVGSYSLETNYTGSVTIEAPSNVDFLPAIQLSSPDLSKEVARDGSIDLRWAALPTCLGQSATIVGMEDKETMIVWSSSEVYRADSSGDMGFLQMAEVRQKVADKVFMPPTQTQALVPAGIFAKCNFASLTMAAYGPGAALDKAQPKPRIQTRSILSVMLGGMGMGPGMDDGE